MLPFPSTRKVNFRNSSGQLFSALVSFLRLLAAFPFGCGFGAGVCLGAGCCILDVGMGSTNIVTRGSVVNAVKSLFRTGVSFVGFKDFGLLLSKDRPKFLICPHYLIQLDACEPSWHLLRQ